MVAEIAPKPELASVSATLMSLGQCVGGILFGVVGVVVASGWGAATGILAAAGIVLALGSIALLIILKARARKRAGVEQA